jgi:hypothetical protein
MLCSMFAFAGCASYEPDAPADPMAFARAYYDATDREYEATLKSAVEYKDRCIARFIDVKGDCVEVVALLRDLNRDAQETRSLAEMAIEANDADLLAEATSALDESRMALREVVLDGFAEERGGAT